MLFPTIGINPQGYADEDVRRACCRGLNDYYADHWMGHPDRMTPVATTCPPSDRPIENAAPLARTQRQAAD